MSTPTYLMRNIDREAPKNPESVDFSVFFFSPLTYKQGRNSERGLKESPPTGELSLRVKDGARRKGYAGDVWCSTSFLLLPRLFRVDGQ